VRLLDSLDENEVAELRAALAERRGDEAEGA
jgi:hypothetical protein